MHRTPFILMAMGLMSVDIAATTRAADEKLIPSLDVECLDDTAAVDDHDSISVRVAPTGKTHEDAIAPIGSGIYRSPGRPRKPIIDRPGDRNWKECPPFRYTLDGERRAGHPSAIAPWARSSVNGHYAGSYVGGGAAIGGRGRCDDEGTWGLDYLGCLRPRQVFLRWTCGREQGGEGRYPTDGEPETVAYAKKFCEVH